MGDEAKVVPLVLASVQVTIDDGAEGAAALDVIEVLTDALERARKGELRSVFVAAVAEGGGAHWTRWACQSVDAREMVGVLAALQHDLLRARG